MEGHWCPCPSTSPWDPAEGWFDVADDDDLDLLFEAHRRLQESTSAPTAAPTGETWEMIYVGVVLLFMFAALLSDRIGVSECHDVCDMSLLGA